MANDLRIALTTSLNDKLVAPLRRSMAEAEQTLQKAEQALQRTDRAGAQASRTLQNMQGPQLATKQAAQLTRETERAIGLADRLRSAWSAAGNVVKGAAAGLAAIQAARMVMSGPMQQARGYEKQLADAANIAYDPGKRRQGMAEMDAAVVAAVRSGGGDRESALQGLNDLFAANIDKGTVMKLLPTMQKYATAGNASPENIAQLVIFGLKSMKLSEDQIPLMLDKTLASTKGGSMEFDTLAKWMPQLGAAGMSAGLTGLPGYEQMLAGAQVSRLTAGTKDEAGTNFRDLLSLLNSHAMQTAGKRAGIDVTGSLSAYIGKGGNALGGIVALADDIANKDKRFAEIDAKLKASGIQRDAKGQAIYTPEQEDLMRQQATLFQGSALGKLFHNQQSMQALVALRNNREYFADLLKGTGEARGQIGEQDFDTIRGTNYFKVQQQENEKLFAQTRALDGANNAMGKLSESTTELYRQYPGLATAMEGAKLATTALAASAAAASGALLMLGGGKALMGRLAVGAVGAAGTSAAATTAAAATGSAAAAGVGMGATAAIGTTAAGALAVGLPILATGAYLQHQMVTPEGLRSRIASRTDRIAELDQIVATEQKAGAAPSALSRLQSQRDQLAQDRNTLLQQYGGNEDSAELVRLMGRSVDAQEKNAAAIQQLADRPVKVTLDGQGIQANVNERNARDARRN